MAQAGQCHLGKRDADEWPHQEPRVWNRQPRLVKDLVIAKKQVDIQGAGRLNGVPGTHPALSALDRQAAIEKRSRRKASFEAHDCIHVVGLRGATLGPRFEEPAARGDSTQGQQRPHCRCEMRRPITEIRS